MQTIIIKPIITESSMKDAGKGKFTFAVAPSATKIDIRLAIQKIFKVHVISVSTTSLTRNKTIFTKFGRKKVKINLKKARVALQKGETIPAFETGEKEKKGKKNEKTEGK